MTTKPETRKMTRTAVTAKPRLPKANIQKFYELVLLIARRSEGDPTFGGFKLNKLLFYVDFLAYLRFGAPITGEEYFALPNGPAPRYRMKRWEAMVESGDIAVRKDPITNQRTPLALREPDLTKFTSQEINLVLTVLDMFRGRSSTAVREATHKFAGWVLAKEKETIPYSVALVSARKPTLREIKAGLELEDSAKAALAAHRPPTVSLAAAACEA
jgi:hypothetical protein